MDSPDGLVVSGAPPGARVTVTTHLELAGQSWQCRADFVADDDGVVDTTVQPSTGGSYQGVDPFGLFWSAEAPPFYDWEHPHPMRVTARATCDEIVGDASFVRLLMSDDVEIHEVAEEGVVGRLYVPASPGPVPAAVLVAGAVGGPGLPETAPLLASHGVLVLSLAHWNHPGLPDSMKEVDVEVVGRACDWLRSRRAATEEAPAVLGVARGGELALLAESCLPGRVGPCATLSGSAVSWGAVGPGSTAADAAWSHDGTPIAHLIRPDDDDWDAVLSDDAAVQAAEIPVEGATGPLLMLSGADDRTWPSARLHERGADRARREDGPEVTCVAYPDAGHLACVPPGFPLASRFELPDRSVRELGGSRAGNNAARLDSWRRILDLVGATR